MPALIKRLKRPKVKTISGFKIVVRIGLMNIFIKVKIPTTYKRSIKAPEKEKPSIKLVMITKAARLQKKEKINLEIIFINLFGVHTYPSFDYNTDKN